MDTPKTREFMKDYLAKHPINNDYWNAYFARRVNNDHVIREVCEELKEHGVKCFVCKPELERYPKYAYIEKGDNNTYFGFAEVPYRWYIGSSYPVENCAGLVGDDSYGFPYDLEDILKELEHSQREKNRPVYLVEI